MLLAKHHKLLGASFMKIIYVLMKNNILLIQTEILLSR